MARSTFAERFGYAGWLYHLRTGRAPTFASIASATGRTGVTVSSWASADDAPSDWRVHQPLAECLGVEELWLIRDEGAAPEPKLWTLWIDARRAGKPAGVTRPRGAKDAPGIPMPSSEQLSRQTKKKGA